MLTGYFDESGHESKDHVIIAGFVGNESQWKAVADAWKEGLGARRGLHMSELRWSKPYTRTLLERLGPIPKQFSLEPAIGGVRVSDYEDLIDGSPWGKLGKGYFASLYPLIVRLMHWLPEGERIELVLDRQEHYQPVAEIIFRALAKLPIFIGKDGLPKLAKWSYVPRGSTLLTELSDYYAFALAHYHKDPNSKKSQWCAPILRGNMEPIGAIWNREQIRTNIKFVHEQMDAKWPNHHKIPLRGWK